MSAPILQFKRGNYDNLDFGLRAGEPALTLDTFDFFVGINSVFADNKFFGSHRYWEREDGDKALRLRLVNKDGDVANSIHLKTPDSHTGVTTYTFPSTPEAGEFLKVDADGNLSWESEFGEINVDELFAGDATFGGDVGFTTTTESTDPSTGGVVISAGLGVGGNVNIGGDLGVTGIGTFGGAVTIYDDTQSTDKDTGALVLEGGLGVEKNVNLGGDLGVTGSATINSTTDTEGNATSGALVVDGGVGIAKSVYIGTDLTVGDHLFVGGTSEFVGVVTFRGGVINIGDEDTDDINVGGEFISGLVPNTDDLHDLGTDVKRWKTLYAVNIETTDVQVAGISTFTGLIDANGGADISGGETILSSATVSDLTAGRVVLAGTSGSLEDSSNLTFGSGGLTVGSGGINVTGVSTFSADVVVGGNVRVNGNNIQASDGNNNITLTSNTLTAFAGDIRVNGNDIRSSSGDVAITLADNDVTVADDLTVQGNLFVNGSTTQVNTTSLTVEDRTIDLGKVSGAAPASSTTWDLGILFNYNASGAKKSAVIWEHEDSRFKFASVVTEDKSAVGTPDGPQLDVTTFAPIEVAELWVNNSCTGEAKQVIGCVSSELQLQNITIDGGSF